MVTELALVEVHEAGLAGRGAGLEHLDLGGPLFESEGGDPGPYSAGGHDDDLVPGRMDVGDGLGEAGDHGMVDATPGVPREDAGADLDDDAFSCLCRGHGWGRLRGLAAPVSGGRDDRSSRGGVKGRLRFGRLPSRRKGFTGPGIFLNRFMAQRKSGGLSAMLIFLGIGSIFTAIGWFVMLRPELEVGKRFVEGTCTLLGKN